MDLLKIIIITLSALCLIFDVLLLIFLLKEGKDKKCKPTIKKVSVYENIRDQERVAHVKNELYHQYLMWLDNKISRDDVFKKTFEKEGK